MKEAIAALTHQMEEARRNLEWLAKEKAELHLKTQRAKRDMYHAQDQILKLKAQHHAE